MNVKPLSDRIVVKPEPAEEKQLQVLFFQIQRKRSHKWVLY